MTFTNYMLIGYLVSLLFIIYFRYEKKGLPKQHDALLGLFGPFIWPLLIVKFLWDLLKMKIFYFRNKNHKF